MISKSQTWNQGETKGWKRVMEEQTSFKRGEERGGEGFCHDGRGDGVLLFDGERPPPRNQPQQLQATSFTISLTQTKI